METSNKIRVILEALGYTPTTLAEATGMSLYKARKIMKGGYSIKCGEFISICKLVGISPNHFFNIKKAGVTA